MRRRGLNGVLWDLRRSLLESRCLADFAYRSYAPAGTRAGPAISIRQRDSVAEIAYLKAFLAWEAFLEQSFVLYLVGRKPGRGRPPHRYTFPPTQKCALEWVAEGRRFAEWTKVEDVSSRAERFFRDGRPFTPVLNGNRSALDEMRTIRNAVAHASSSAQERFEEIARQRIGALPPGLTVGAFLLMTVPHSTLPNSFLEHYIAKLEFAAERIVPA